MFCDESAANERVGDRRRVWGPRWVKIVHPLPFSKGEKFSILPAFTAKGFLCYKVIQESFNSVIFFYFVRDTLLPHYNQFPARHSVIVMDNCQIHRHPMIREVVEEAGCKLIMLPPYSPDYNPIEIAFGKMKKWIQRHHVEFAEAIVWNQMKLFFSYAISLITDSHARSFFRKSGYM